MFYWKIVLYEIYIGMCKWWKIISMNIYFELYLSWNCSFKIHSFRNNKTIVPKKYKFIDLFIFKFIFKNSNILKFLTMI